VLSSGVDNIYNIFLKLKALDSLKDNLKFRTLILTAKRVNNILRGQPKYKVNQDLLIEKEERELYTTYSIIRDNVRTLFLSGDFSKAQRIVLTIGSSIDNFFDNVLVMAEDKRIKRNRLALLQQVSKLFSQIANYSEVVIEGEKD
jgi:glycyl-tRNA synthetase beta chain